MDNKVCFILNSLRGALLTILFIASAALAADGSAAATEKYSAPRWAFALKGGEFEPDLENYAQFYGSDTVTYWSVEGSYRLTNWLEFGGEIGYSKDKGAGSLPNAGTQGGQVDYTLMPAQLFLNFRYEKTPRQLFVPYAGVGIATAWYRQKISQQSDREGRADVGGAARVGLELLLNRFDRRGASYVRDGRRLNTYLFLEGQVFKTETEDVNLGGKVYLLGLRFAFDGR